METKTKRKRRCRFLLCFGGRSSTMEVNLDEGSTGSTSSASSSSGVPQSDEDTVSRKEQKRKRKIRRLLSKIVRSAIFIKSLEKGRGDKIPEDTDSSVTRESSVSSRTDVARKPPLFISPSTSSSSSSFSVAGPPLLAPVVPPQPRKIKSALRFGSLPFLAALVVLSLVVMLLWGRVCAILWTSTCLCLAPRGTLFLTERVEEADDEARRPTVVEGFGNYRNST